MWFHCLNQIKCVNCKKNNHNAKQREKCGFYKTYRKLEIKNLNDASKNKNSIQNSLGTFSRISSYHKDLEQIQRDVASLKTSSIKETDGMESLIKKSLKEELSSFSSSITSEMTKQFKYINDSFQKKIEDSEASIMDYIRNNCVLKSQSAEQLINGSSKFS